MSMSARCCNSAQVARVAKTLEWELERKPRGPSVVDSWALHKAKAEFVAVLTLFPKPRKKCSVLGLGPDLSPYLECEYGKGLALGG